MPLYEYHCPSCNNKFEKLQPMSSTGAECPSCEQPAKRAISVFASISSGGPASDMGFNTMPPPMGGGGCCGGGCCASHWWQLVVYLNTGLLCETLSLAFIWSIIRDIGNNLYASRGYCCNSRYDHRYEPYFYSCVKPEPEWEKHYQVICSRIQYPKIVTEADLVECNKYFIESG